MIEVTVPHKIIPVEEEDDDERKLIRFASKRIPYYNPRAGYAYCEFSKPIFLLPERNVIAKKKVLLWTYLTTSIILYSKLIVLYQQCCRMESSSLDLVFVHSLVLVRTMMEQKKLNHQI